MKLVRLKSKIISKMSPKTNPISHARSKPLSRVKQKFQQMAHSYDESYNPIFQSKKEKKVKALHYRSLL